MNLSLNLTFGTRNLLIDLLSESKRYFKKILKFAQSLSTVRYLHLDQSIRGYLNKKMVKKKAAFDATKFQYQPITYQPCEELYQRIKAKLLETGHEKTPLYANCETLINDLPNLLETADKSCCGQIRSNGIFSHAKLIFRTFEVLDRELHTVKSSSKAQQDIESFNIISSLMVRLNELQVLIASKTNLGDPAVEQELDDELRNNYPEFHRNLRMFRQVMVTKDPTHVNANLIRNGSISTLNSSFNINSVRDASIRSDSTASLKEEAINGSIHDSIIDASSLNRSLINNNLLNNSFDNTNTGEQFSSLPLFSPHLEVIVENINEAINQPRTPHKDIIYREYFMMWIDDQLRSFFRLYIFVLPFLRTRLYKYPHLLFSEKFRSRVLNKIMTFPTVNFPFEFWNISDNKVSLLFVKYKTRNTKTKSKEIFIPTQNSIIINQSPYDRLTINDSDRINFTKERQVRCKYIRPKNCDLEELDRLLIHYHGGGFFSQSCDSHEIYLRGWANANQIPIITVDYQIKMAFPAGIKDCLDVYVWLRMAPEDEIRAKLGFFPKKIVIAGDSAGGNLGFGLTLALNDLRTDYKSKFDLIIPMPDGLVCIYTPFLINTSVCPSRLLGALDTLVPTSIELIILYGISGLIPDLKPNTRLQAIMTYLFPFRDPKPWFDCTPTEFKERVEGLAKLITSPYLTALFYEKFDTFTDVPMHMVTAEFCSFLDESITMAKLWKGPLKVDVIPDLCHGFLNLKFVGKNVSNATMFVGQKIKEMFEQVDAREKS